MRQVRGGWIAGVAVAALAAAHPAAAQRVDYSGSLQYATGEYFLTERANSIFLTNGLGVSLGPLRASASIPLILQSTPLITYTTVGTGGGGIGGSLGGTGSEVVVDTASQAQLGLGDPMAYLGLELLGGPAAALSLRLTGSFKAPLGDVERGFSTGEWDYAAGVSLSALLAGTLVFADLSYWVFGEPPGVEYRDPLAYSLGFGRPLGGGKLGVLASVLGYTEVIEGVPPPVQAAVNLSYLIDSRRGLMAGVSFGLTESSPDVALSIGWSLIFTP